MIRTYLAVATMVIYIFLNTLFFLPLLLILDEKKERVRLIGVDTPETKHPKKGIQYFGAEVFEFTKNILTEGKTIYLEFDVGQRDRYGRLLAYVWLEKPAARIS